MSMLGLRDAQRLQNGVGSLMYSDRTVARRTTHSRKKSWLRRQERAGRKAARKKR